MAKRWRSIGVALIATAFIGPISGHAATSQQQAFGRWKLQDKCVQAANKAYPDHTPAALLMRDRSVEKCLEAAGQPPRDPLLNETTAPDKKSASEPGARLNPP